MLVRLSATARGEARAARKWYRLQGREAEAKFGAELRRTIAQLRRYPLSGPEVEFDPRRLLVDDFPYAFIYRVGPTGVEVVAVAHTSRRPDYWRDR